MVSVVILRGDREDLSYGLGYGDGAGYGTGFYGTDYGADDGAGHGYGRYGTSHGTGFRGDGFYGEGHGAGMGDGDKHYWRMAMDSMSQSWLPDQRRRLAELEASGVRLAYWRSDAAGQAANNGRLSTLAATGVTHTEGGPLMLCSAGTLHATMLPPRWKGERLWIVALHGQVIGDDEKYGCLEREIIGECWLKP